MQFQLNAIRNCGKKGNEDDYSTRLLSRNEVKQLMQIFLNGDNDKTYYLNGLRPELNKLMEMKYLKLFEIVKSFKDNGDKLYYALVAIETNLIMGIVSDLYNTYNDIKILSCHDAIYCPKGFKQKTQQIWDKHIADFIKDLPIEHVALFVIVFI